MFRVGDYRTRARSVGDAAGGGGLLGQDHHRLLPRAVLGIGCHAANFAEVLVVCQADGLREAAAEAKRALASLEGNTDLGPCIFGKAFGLELGGERELGRAVLCAEKGRALGNICDGVLAKRDFDG